MNHDVPFSLCSSYLTLYEKFAGWGVIKEDGGGKGWNFVCITMREKIAF